MKIVKVFLKYLVSNILKIRNRFQILLKHFRRPHLVDFPYFLLSNPLAGERVYSKHLEASETKTMGAESFVAPSKKSFFRTAFFAQKSKSVWTHTQVRKFGQSTKLLTSSFTSENKKGNTSIPSSVLFIYIDGLSPFLLLPNHLGKVVMEFTASLFGEGFVLRNFFSAGEWTLPNIASMLYGRQPSSHGLYLPDHAIKKSFVTPRETSIFQHLSNCNVKTTIFSANPYMNPNYGFHLGTKEFFYKKNATGKEILSLFRSHTNKQTNIDFVSRFDALFFMDIHHDLGENYGERTKPTRELIESVTSLTRLNSVDAQQLIKRAESLDILLEKELQSEILQKYDSVILISDHGSARLREEIELCLDDARTRTTFAISNRKRISIDPETFVGISAVPSILSAVFGSEPFPSEWDYMDELVFSESIYPKLPYRLRLRNANFCWDFSSDAFWSNKNHFIGELERFLFENSRKEYFRELERFRRGFDSPQG